MLNARSRLGSSNYVFPNSMEQFCIDLEKKPLVVYLAMLLASKCAEEPNFLFPPYQSVFNLLKEKGFNNDTLKDLEARGYPFSESAWFIQKCVQEGGLHEDDKITTIKKEKSGHVRFKFACNVDLTELFFVHSRAIPVFPLAVLYTPTAYDAHFSTKSFWGHDRAHTCILSNLYQENYLDFLSENGMQYPVLDHYLFSIYILSIVERILNKSLKNAIELILFQLLHEEGNYREYSYIPAGIWDKDYFIMGVDQAFSKARGRQSGKFAYSAQYKTSEVSSKLSEAMEFIFQAASAYQKPELDEKMRLSYLAPTEENIGQLMSLLEHFEDKAYSQADSFIRKNSESLGILFSAESERRAAVNPNDSGSSSNAGDSFPNI